MNMLPAAPGIERQNLDFGSAIHRGLETFYDKEKQPENDEQREFLCLEAIGDFRTYMQNWADILIANERFHVEARAEWSRLMDLGTDMLTRYFEWADEEDEDYEIAYSEVEFEIPVEIYPFPNNVDSPIGHAMRNNAGVAATMGEHLLLLDPTLEELGIDPNKRYLTVLNTDYQIVGIVVIQGRLDLIVRGVRSGRYKIIDHKTAGQFRNDYEWMDIDPQASTYFFAAKAVLGIDVEEVIFNQLLKRSPERPAVGKRGYLSEAKNQFTTKAVFRQEMERLGHTEMHYQKFFNEYEEPIFFRRIPTSRNAEELEAIRRHIILEAVDMLNDPNIYPNPSSWNCNGCAFRHPCRLWHTDSIEYAQWFLTDSGAYVESQGY